MDYSRKTKAELLKLLGIQNRSIVALALNKKELINIYKRELIDIENRARGSSTTEPKSSTGKKLDRMQSVQERIDAGEILDVEAEMTPPKKEKDTVGVQFTYRFEGGTGWSPVADAGI